MTKTDIHHFIISSYLYTKCLYSFSFIDRIRIALGILDFFPRSYSKELDILSDEELSKKMDELQKPWWYDVYEEAFYDKEHFFEVLYPQYKHSTLDEVMKDKEAYKAFCNDYKAHKPNEKKLLAIYPHLQDREFKEALEDCESK